MVRPRSSKSHEKVLRAALDLFGERGIDATSMDSIASASGVSKATIYKHWADKEALLMEVMLLIHGLDREPEDVDSGDLRRDLATVLTRRPPDEFDKVRERIMPSLIAYATVHREFGKAWRTRVMEPPRQCLKSILQRGIDRGLLPAALDLELALALLLGPVFYVRMFQMKGLPGVSDIGPRAAEAFWRGFAIKKMEKPAAKSKRPSLKK
jgi:AcrR family transcriptional regulator